jgi:mannosyl-oligosaccharide glucosidase
MLIPALRLLLVTLLLSVCYGLEQSTAEAYAKASRDSLLWGAYRPNTYFGVRPRIPHSLTSGLFWFNADDVNNIHNIRHFCDQGLDFQGFGWERYDPRFGGHQVMKDNELGIDLTIDFVKTNDGSWASRVKGVPRQGYEGKATSVVFYTALEGEDSMLTSASGKPFDGFSAGETIKLFGQSVELESFEIDITDGPPTNNHKKVRKSTLLEPSLDPGKTHYLSLNVPDDNSWKATDIFGVLLQDSIKDLSEKHHHTQINPDPASLMVLRNVNDFEGNLHMVQKIFKGEFEFDVIYNSEKSKKKITPESIPSLIQSMEAKFDTKFERAFELQEPFTGPKYQAFAKEVFSNLLGGIGYYYGDHLVDRHSELNEETYDQIKLNGAIEGPTELFTSCPSRTFFPRGFYWDEGFHLIPILEYDVDLTLEIVKSWFNLMDDDGWIAREQILGPEARSKVPEDFQVQSPKIANPPTLMLVFMDLLAKAKKAKDEVGFNVDVDQPEEITEFGDIDFAEVSDAHIRYPELLIDYAEQIYPKLQLHYNWFRKTQRGELEEFDREPYSLVEAYRWSGRTFSHCLPSGLDDYPRAPVPDIAELNVDLISWIGVMTRSMRQIAELLGKKEDAVEYQNIEHDIKKNIEDLHWSEEDKTYCDVSVDRNDDDAFYCFKGYVSLFPFLLKHLEPGNGHLKHLIELISDPEELFSPYGIRSLSKKDANYKTGEDYWKSPIWYNINYLILEALQHYGSGANGALLDESTRALANDTYSTLRVNLVLNAMKNWEETGYLYEQYNDVTGAGQGAKHFTGWTALTAFMMKMPPSLVV